MKKLTVTLCFSIFIFIGIFTANAYFIDIDGDISDWGINLSEANSKEYLDNNIPSGGLDIDYVTEDNADASSGWTTVGPGWTYENYFDVEAIYFDNDQDNVYIAIIQGLPASGYQINGYPKFYPGDIGIDADNRPDTGESGYEFGLVTIDRTLDDSTVLSAGELYENPTWKTVHYGQYNTANPWSIDTPGTQVIPTGIEFTYGTNINTHYVLEAKIPLDSLGLSANYGEPVQSLRIHWTQECGNDCLNLNADVNPTPEPTTIALMCFGLLGILCFGLKQRQKKSSIQ